MPFNSSGVFTRVHDWVTDRNNGVKILADRHDEEDDGFATGLSNTICRDGQSTTTAAIPFAQGITIANGESVVIGTGGTVELGHASDTTLSRQSAGRAQVESSAVITSADLLTSYISISPDAGDPDNDIEFAAGSVVSSAGTAVLSLAAAMTKKMDASWAAGDDAGGLFDGTMTGDTTYHCFVIRKDSDGSIDAGFDTSLTAANIPGGYTAYRRVGSIYVRSPSVTIAPFVQVARGVFVDTGGITHVINGVTPGTSGTLYALTGIPAGLRIKVFGTAFCFRTGAASHAAFYHGFMTAPSTPANHGEFYGLRDGTAGSGSSTYIEAWTDTSRQIGVITDNAGTEVDFVLAGYFDPTI